MLEIASRSGYKELLKADVTSEPLPWFRSFDAAVSVGVLGEWIPSALVVRKLLGTLKQQALVGLGMEVTHTNANDICTELEAAEFAIIECLNEEGLRHPEYPTEDYFYLVAQRGVVESRKLVHLAPNK
jgi:hypothetical protein